MPSTAQTIPQISPKPFLKWVGGKRRLADQLISLIPEGLNNYYEPFLGGGALFFRVKHLFKQCYLSDINLDLVTTYNAVKKDPQTVWELLEEHSRKNSKEYYWHLRATNNSNDPFKISARFVYLNHCSFKGIYRLNKEGTVSSSYSTRDYSTKKVRNALKTCSDFLSDAIIYAGDYSFIEAKKNDFVYLDPPYHKAGERYYIRIPFRENDQIRLRDFVKELDLKGVKVMISNSDTEFVRDLYKSFNINTIEVSYCLTNSREKVNELVITNF